MDKICQHCQTICDQGATICRGCGLEFDSLFEWTPGESQPPQMPDFVPPVGGTMFEPLGEGDQESAEPQEVTPTVETPQPTPWHSEYAGQSVNNLPGEPTPEEPPDISPVATPVPSAAHSPVPQSSPVPFPWVPQQTYAPGPPVPLTPPAGQPPMDPYSSWNTPAPVVRKSKTPVVVGAVAGILAVVLLVFTGITIRDIWSGGTPAGSSSTSTTTALDELANMEYFILGSDRVPSVRTVLGEERNIVDGSLDEDEDYPWIILEYHLETETSNEDMRTYVHHLVDVEDFSIVRYPNFNHGSGSVELWKPSIDSDAILTINIDYYYASYHMVMNRTPYIPPMELDDRPETEGSFGGGAEYIVPAGWVRMYPIMTPMYVREDSHIVVSFNYWPLYEQSTYLDYRREALEVGEVSVLLGAPEEVTGSGEQGWRLTYEDRRTNEHVLVYMVSHETDVIEIQCSAPGGDAEAVSQVTSACEDVVQSVVFT